MIFGMRDKNACHFGQFRALSQMPFDIYCLNPGARLGVTGCLRRNVPHQHLDSVDVCQGRFILVAPLSGTSLSAHVIRESEYSQYCRAVGRNGGRVDIYKPKAVVNVANVFGVGTQEMLGDIRDWQGKGTSAKSVIGGLVDIYKPEEVANVANRSGVGRQEILGDIQDCQAKGMGAKNVFAVKLGGKVSAGVRSRDVQLAHVAGMCEARQKKLQERLDAASPTCLKEGCDRKWDPTDSRRKVGAEVGAEGWVKVGGGYGCTKLQGRSARNLLRPTRRRCTETAYARKPVTNHKSQFRRNVLSSYARSFLRLPVVVQEWSKSGPKVVQN